jgi:hypothetical protein
MNRGWINVFEVQQGLSVLKSSKASIQLWWEIPSPRVKRLGCECYHYSSYRPKVMNAWNFTSVLKHGDGLALYQNKSRYLYLILRAPV